MGLYFIIFRRLKVRSDLIIEASTEYLSWWAGNNFQFRCTTELYFYVFEKFIVDMKLCCMWNYTSLS